MDLISPRWYPGMVRAWAWDQSAQLQCVVHIYFAVIRYEFSCVHLFIRLLPAKFWFISVPDSFAVTAECRRGGGGSCNDTASWFWRVFSPTAAIRLGRLHDNMHVLCMFCTNLPVNGLSFFSLWLPIVSFLCGWFPLVYCWRDCIYTHTRIDIDTNIHEIHTYTDIYE